MNDHVEYDARWAYWIDPRTFLMKRVKGSIPLGTIVLTKQSDTLDDGRRIINTTYSIATEDGVIPSSKREVSKRLAKQMLRYMRNRGEYPPFTEISKVFSNGNVDLLYHPTGYDKFTLRLTPDLVGEDVEMFLSQLSEPESEEMEPPWMIEPAKSSRARCRSCGKKISKGELRLGQPSIYEGHVTYRWHHLQCGAYKIKGMRPSELKGYDNLTDEQKNEFQKILV